MQQSITLLELNQLIARLMTVPPTQNVWVTAELSDVNARGGHCYMELLQKDDRGQQLAKARGVIWANNYSRIAANFLADTGQRFTTGIKVMLRVSATMHPVYGMSLVVSDVNPEYTMGDLLRRRNEILKRLKAEGVLDLNKQLEWSDFPHRVAVISAPAAAGYGDFINQLYSNPSRLRFNTRLFPAIMQGEKSPASIIAALDQIACEIDDWDCVAIIRGGGATSDLQAFEDYELASAIAQFPLPVMIGIGHERDVTVLDYVANMRVKTPTAAAEYLIGLGEMQLSLLQRLGSQILQSTTDIISSSKEQLSYFEGLLPIAPGGALTRADSRLRQAAMSLGGISARRIAPAMERLKIVADSLQGILTQAIARSSQKLDARQNLLDALSPHAVLARGYSITRVNGHAVTDPSQIGPDDTIETILARGSVKSSLQQQQNFQTALQQQ